MVQVQDIKLIKLSLKVRYIIEVHTYIRIVAIINTWIVSSF